MWLTRGFVVFQNTFQHSEIQDPRSDLLPCWFNFAHKIGYSAYKIGSSGSGIPVTCRFASRKTTHKLLLLQKNWFVIQTHNLPNLGSEFCIWGTKWRIWAAFRKNTKSGAELMLEWEYDLHLHLLGVQIHVHVSFSVGPSYNSSWPSSYHWTDVMINHRCFWWQIWAIWAPGCLVHICPRSDIS